MLTHSRFSVFNRWKNTTCRRLRQTRNPGAS